MKRLFLIISLAFGLLSNTFAIEFKDPIAKTLYYKIAGLSEDALSCELEWDMTEKGYNENNQTSFSEVLYFGSGKIHCGDFYEDVINVHNGERSEYKSIWHEGKGIRLHNINNGNDKYALLTACPPTLSDTYSPYRMMENIINKFKAVKYAALEKTGGRRALLCYFKKDSGKISLKATLDDSGYPLEITLFNPASGAIEEYVTFVWSEKNGIRYPVDLFYGMHFGNGKKFTDWIYHIKKISFRDIKDKEFAFDLPEDTRVTDYTVDPPIHYRTPSPSALTGSSKLSDAGNEAIPNTLMNDGSKQARSLRRMRK